MGTRRVAAEVILRKRPTSFVETSLFAWLCAILYFCRRRWSLFFEFRLLGRNILLNHPKKGPPGLSNVFAKMGAMIRPEDDQRNLFVATAMSLLVLTVVATILRLLSRWIANVGLWWDDYLILFGEVSCIRRLVVSRRETLMPFQLVLIAAFTVNVVGNTPKLKNRNFC